MKKKSIAKNTSAKRESAATDRRKFLSGAGKLAGVATLFGLSATTFSKIVSADATPAVAPKPQATAAMLELRARAEVLREFLTTGKVDEAVAKFPQAKLTAAQIAGLKQFSSAELAAIRSFRAKLQALNLPEVVGISGNALVPWGADVTLGGGVTPVPGPTPNGAVGR